MKSFLSKIFAFLILAICTVGFSSTIVPAFAHDPSDGYRAGYQSGYQQGYEHGYQDAASGQSYENVAESHGAEAYGPYGAGMHEGEHAGYDAGFRAGSGHQQHRHHGFRVIIGG
jgi:hypothetical protein